MIEVSVEPMDPIRSEGRTYAILVEPKYQGNIGSVARCARNFSLDGLILVNPPPLEDEAYAYAMHGKGMLLNAVTVSTFQEAVSMVDSSVGSSGISDSAERCYQRNPMTPEEMVRWARRAPGSIGIVLGREDKGLLREELERCDLLVTVPADPGYPVLNLSHAACLLFYELYKARGSGHSRNARGIYRREKEVLLEHYDKLMHASGVPPHKVPISRTNFRRMISRATLNYREFNSLMGTFSRAMDYKRERSPFRKDPKGTGTKTEEDA
ncbi:MAG: RNA methyltransferase [Candidatus Thermoplasmatota archaeon]|jgi:TrmH family RNA methyltransferase|nr:RNA methyltransferase [Candidatus Thermoplasmatota archaeon]